MSFIVPNTRNDSVSITTASKEICNQVQFSARRKELVITNTGVNTVYIAKGMSAAVAGAGIPLAQGVSFFETDGENFSCWQGAIQCIGADVSTVAISETIEVRA